MKKPNKHWLSGVWVLLLGLAAVSLLGLSLRISQAQTGPSPDTVTALTAGGCVNCHTIPGVPNAVGQVGPNLANIGFNAWGRVSGMSAEAYIRESITNPSAFIAPNCPTGPCQDGIMPPNLTDFISAQNVDDIVAYLLTLVPPPTATPLPTDTPEPTPTGTPVPTSTPVPTMAPGSFSRPLEASIVPFAEPPRTHDDAMVLLGQSLFFDPRLSADVSISCASCHQPDNYWSDGQSLSDGYPSTGYFRNAPSIMNTVYMDYLYWDGRMDGSDMPTLIRDHITEAHFMNLDGRLMTERIKQVPEYVTMFHTAFGDGPSFGKILNALTAYVQSVNSGMSPYDHFMAGDSDALSEDAQAGLALFEGAAGCANCHSGPVFSDNQFHILGVPENGNIWSEPARHITFRRFFRLFGVPNYRALTSDPGLYALTKDDADWGAFRTAPLREVAETAPYMHNGVLMTLEDVVNFYNEGAATGEPLDLTDEEILQLVAFLESLSSPPAAITIPEQPEYQLRPLGDNR